MRALVADLRLAIRLLANERGFAIVAVLTIALGVGVNTAVFSVINAVLIDSLPYVDSDRIVALHETQAQSPGERDVTSYPNFLDWRQESRLVAGLAAFSEFAYTVTIGDLTERVGAPQVSWNYFDVLGARPQRGRVFLPSDDTRTAALVVILSDALWERAFHRDPGAIGSTLRLDGQPATVVGIMPPEFSTPPDVRGLRDRAALWVPISRFALDGSMLTDRTFDG